MSPCCRLISAKIVGLMQPGSVGRRHGAGRDRRDGGRLGVGRLKGGRHLAYTDKPSMANLLVTLMDKMDVPVERLGGSTGKLPLDTVSL